MVVKCSGKYRKIRASLTVEAAFVIPLAFFTLVLYAYLFLMVHTEFIVYQGLLGVADRISEYGTAGAYVEKSTLVTDIIEAAGSDVSTQVEELSSDVLSYLTGSASRYYTGLLLKKQLANEDRELSCINGGNDGIDCSASKVFGGSGWIVLKAKYTFHFPVSLFKIGDREVVLTVNTAGFYGTDWNETAEFDDAKRRSEDNAHPPEAYVYRTDNGVVYHRNVNCTYIRIDVHEVSALEIGDKRNPEGKKYYPCEKCVHEGPEGIVYITTYGTRYHNDRSCSELERNPKRLTLTEAENQGLRPCSKCGEG